MAQPTHALCIRRPRMDLPHVASKVLLAWRNGESCCIDRELENARLFTAKIQPADTLEMETMEVLSGAVESLRQSCGKHAGAVRLLEHLAQSACVNE